MRELAYACQPTHDPTTHVQVAYAPDPEAADRALLAKAALFQELGVVVHLCGDVKM